MYPFAVGLQELLSEGNFVDVRLSCSDHSPSDGLGSHKLVLAGASPDLLKLCLDTGEEEDMVCILLPDFPSSLVASVLSILYYGEVWLSQLSHQIETVNSLFNALGLDLRIVRLQDEMKLVKRTEVCHKRSGGVVAVKKEPAGPPSQAIVNIKKEKGGGGSSEGSSGIRRSFIPTVQTATVQTSSLLKCPNFSCEFHAESIPEMQNHIYQCKLKQGYVESAHHVDVKPANLNIKREQNVKLESVDPLEREEDEGGGDGEQPPDTKVAVTRAGRSGKVAPVKMELDTSEDDDEAVDDPQPAAAQPQQSSSGEAVEDGAGGERKTTRLECAKCAYSTTSISALGAHAIMHQRKESLRDSKTDCPVCSFKANTLTDLKQHIFRTYSVQSSGSINCKLRGCGKEIASTGEEGPDSLLFYHHVLYDHYGKRYKLQCEFCEFSSVDTKSLKEHLMIHVNERPLPCPHCSQSFRTRGHLNEHIKNMHTQEKPFKCQDCQTSFASESLYRRHRKLKHPDQTFICQLCKKVFRNENNLNAHVRNVHSVKEGCQIL